MSLQTYIHTLSTQSLNVIHYITYVHTTVCASIHISIHILYPLTRAHIHTHTHTHTHARTCTHTRTHTHTHTHTRTHTHTGNTFSTIRGHSFEWTLLPDEEATHQQLEPEAILNFVPFEDSSYETDPIIGALEGRVSHSSIV